MTAPTVTSTTLRDGVAVVTLTGELDLHDVREINDALVSALVHGTVVCDVAGVTFADSSILGTFVMVRRNATQAGGSFSLVGASPTLRRLLDLTGLSELLPVHEDLATALASGRHDPVAVPA